MIFYDSNGKLIVIDRSKFINDELYYKKILELKSKFAKSYTIKKSIDIDYNNNLGYTSDNDSDTE